MKAKLLLVDDTPEVLLALAAILQPLGCQISQTTSGREALQRVNGEEFDFMLLDANMPDINGIDIARHLLSRTEWTYLPMMLMVEPMGLARGANMQFGCGEIDVLIKPINPRELKQKVGAFLDLLQHQQKCQHQAVALAYFAQRMQETSRLCQTLKQDVVPNFSETIGELLETIKHLRAGTYGDLPDELASILPVCERQACNISEMFRELNEKIMQPVVAETMKRSVVTAPPIQPQAAPPSRATQNARILVVEDNAVNAMTMIHSLKSYGYEVAHAANGRDALQLAKDEHPSLILMDIQLPEMDGLEATRQIRADESLRATPIIAISAVAMPGDKERGMEAGLDLYLTKPVRLRELAEIIAQYLNR